MRRLLAVLTLAVIAGACSGDATAPADDLASLDEMADFAYGATRVGDPGGHFLGRLAQLPGDLALTAAQTTQINALVADFIAATAADRDALAALMNEARQARQGGATADEVRAILAAGTEIRTRLRDAEHVLRQAVLDVLTPAQRTWLASHTPREPGPCSTLTDDQRTEISGLFAAFEAANAADIEIVRSARDRVLAARAAGASRQQIAAIMAEAHDAMHRLRTAHAALRDAINAVLTPAQRAAGCFR